MSETTTEEEKEFTVIYADGSTAIIKGGVTRIDHGVTDENGIPKVSVHINAPVATPRSPEELEADRLKELYKEGV